MTDSHISGAHESVTTLKWTFVMCTKGATRLLMKKDAVYCFSGLSSLSIVISNMVWN